VGEGVSLWFHFRESMVKISRLKVGRKIAGFGVLALTVVGCLITSIASAQRVHGPDTPRWRGDISHFHEHDWGLWRGGHWSHARHDGRMGWWWVIGANWYFYPSPVYPYPSPWEPPPTALVSPPVGVAPLAPPTPYWYYCESSNGYYPYVPTCPGGWAQRPATPSDAMPGQPK